MYVGAAGATATPQHIQATSLLVLAVVHRFKVVQVGSYAEPKNDYAYNNSHLLYLLSVRDLFFAGPYHDYIITLNPCVFNT